MLRKIVLSFLIVLALVISVLAWNIFIRFLPIFPHDRITISLPFAKEDDDLIFINPMGETDHHTPPVGHPGFDFGWHHPAPLLAAAAGKVTRIEEHKAGGFGETEKIYDVEIVTGIYAIRYEEISPNPNLKVGMNVNQGDVIGRGGKYIQEGGLGTYYSTHWEFDYDTFWYDRLCPLTFFDSDSRPRIEKIWSKVGQTYEGQFPEICSGAFKGKDQ